MEIQCVWEHNGSDSILYASSLVGAFTRGETKNIALQKIAREAASYLEWKGEAVPDSLEPVIVQEKASALMISDADTDVLFEDEKSPCPQRNTRARRRLHCGPHRTFWICTRRSPIKIKAVFRSGRPSTGRSPVRHPKCMSIQKMSMTITLGRSVSGTIMRGQS